VSDATDPLDILADDLNRFRDDPLGFVLWAFPWGEAGSGLDNETGPDTWQREQLIRIGQALAADPENGRVQEITTSGHGIGKSCEVAWLIIWAVLTYPDAKAVITANTDTQLRTKTWAEVSKWYYLLDPLLREQFECTATALYSKDPEHEKTWRADAIPNSPTNPAAFAGAHNAGKRLLLVMDEGSEIDEVIYETMEGATTDADTQIIFMVYGNPTKPVGAFADRAVGRFRHMWRFNKIDSRDVKRTDKEDLQRKIDAHGLDSDYVRVRIRGEFPRAGFMQLIPSDVVQVARKRAPLYLPNDPLILGVDCARYGDDQSVLAPRRGLDAKTIPWRKLRNVSTMILVDNIVQMHNQWGFDAIMIDDGSFGAAIIDRLLQMNIRNVFPVTFGGSGGLVQYNDMQMKVHNKRTEIWVKMRHWLYSGGAIPDDNELEQDCVGPQYSYAGDQSSIVLERKEDMKKPPRNLPSPDNGDALACTFAYEIAPRAWSNPNIPGSGMVGPRQEPMVGDYDLYADLR
jgi:hypothetical protein